MWTARRQRRRDYGLVMCSLPRAQVLPKGSTSPLYVDSAAPEGGDAEDPKPHRFPKSPRVRAGHRRGGCLGRCARAALHAAGLVFAEYPLRAHREWCAPTRRFLFAYKASWEGCTPRGWYLRSTRCARTASGAP